MSDIVIKMTDKRWELIIDDSKNPHGPQREFSNAQIVLSFILVALYMPRPKSQAEQLQWVRDYIDIWASIPGNALLRAVERSSKTSIDRYLTLAHNAQLHLPDGRVTTFGSYLHANLEEAKKNFPPFALYAEDINAEWVARALGVALPTLVPKDVSCETEQEHVLIPTKKPNIVQRFKNVLADWWMDAWG